MSAAAPEVVRQRPDDPLLSVVCPVFREEETLDELTTRLFAVLDQLDVRSEVVLVNDGSDDGTGALLRALCEREPRAKLVDLSRNFGHQLAITAGLDHASGDAVVMMDADLQDPPEVIPAMIEQWRAGWDVVYGVRSRREGERALIRWTASGFYRLINRLSDTPLPLDAGDFRLMDVAVVDVLRELREENRYLRGLVSWVGFEQTAVEYVRDPRFAGESKYFFGRRLRLAFDAVTSFSERPLRFALGFGTIVMVLAGLLAAYIVLAKSIDPSQSIAGYASLMVAVLFFGGVQLVCVGLLGEYVGRTYRESKRRPLYVVRERRNIEGGPQA